MIGAWEDLKHLPYSVRTNITNLEQKSILSKFSNDIANASNARKGNFGEIGADLDLNSKGYESLMSKRIKDIDASGHNGIDGVYKKNGEYFIIEGKYKGKSSLNSANEATGLPRQMSDDWIATRDWDSVNLVQSEIRNLITNKNYQSVLAKVAPDGSVTYSLIDEFGYVIRGNAGVFNP